MLRLNNVCLSQRSSHRLIRYNFVAKLVNCHVSPPRIVDRGLTGPKHVYILFAMQRRIFAFPKVQMCGLFQKREPYKLGSASFFLTSQPAPPRCHPGTNFALFDKNEWACIEAALAKWEETLIQWQSLRQLSTVPVVFIELPYNPPHLRKSRRVVHLCLSTRGKNRPAASACGAHESCSRVEDLIYILGWPPTATAGFIAKVAFPIFYKYT